MTKDTVVAFRAPEGFSADPLTFGPASISVVCCTREILLSQPGKSRARSCRLLREPSRPVLNWRTTVTVRQLHSDVDALSDAQRVFQLDAQISDGTIDFRVTKQQLNGAKVARLTVNLRSFGSTHRVCTISAGFQTNRSHPVTQSLSHPVTHEPTILPR